MDGHTLWTTFCGGIGYGIMHVIMNTYFDRKRARTEITLVPDRKGNLVDTATLFERKVIRWYIVVMISLVVASQVVLSNL